VTQDDLALSITGLRPGETPFLQPLGTDPESASVPDEDFSRLRWPLQNKNRCPLRGSHDKRSRTRPYSPSNPLRMSVNSRSQIDPCGWAQSKHGLRPRQDAHQAFERTRIKIRMHLDPAPARQHHGQPTTRFLLHRRGGQLHRHKPTGRRGWSTPSLPTPLFQMANQSAEAQTSTLAKLAPPHTAAHKLSHQLLNLHSCTSLGR